MTAAAGRATETGAPASAGRFPRHLRLKRRRLIRPLFDRNSDARTAAVGDIRLLYRWADRGDAGVDVPYQIGFAVPRRIQLATRRNRVKRKLRAAFQACRSILDQAEARPDRLLTVMVVFRGQNVESDSLSKDLESALARMVDELAS